MSSLKWILVVCLALFQNSFLVSGQDIDKISLGKKILQISCWRPSDGLPTWQIRSMAKDQRGLMWMATDVGLVSFDGKHFNTHPLNIPNVQNKNLSRVIVDHQQNIWLFFQTADSLSIHVYDPFKGLSFSSGEYTGRQMQFTNNVISSICTVHDTIWLLDPQRRKGGFIDLNGQWNQVFEDKEPNAGNMLYYPAGTGLFWSFNREQKEIRLKDAHGRTLEKYSFQDTPISNIYISGSGDFLLTSKRSDQDGSPVGVLRCVSGEGLKALSKSENYQLKWGNSLVLGYSLLPLRANNPIGIEINCSENGFDLYDHGNMLYKGLDNYFRKNYRLELEQFIFQPEDKSFWMIAPGGLVRLEILPNHFTSDLDGIPFRPSTRGLQVLGKKLYVNSYKGHYEVDLQKKVWKPLSVLNKHPYGLALSAHEGLLWSGHHSRVVSIYNPDNGKAKFITVSAGQNYFEGLSFFFPDQHSTYFGTTSGLFHYDIGSSIFESCGLDGLGVYCFHRNSSGLWVGTTKGLMLQTPSKKLTDPGFLPVFPLLIHSTIKYIHEDRDGVFWMATNEGLLRWRPFSSELEIFNTENSGFPSDKIHAVYEDNLQRLWMPSDHGIICFEKKTNDFQTFTVADGLNTDEMNQLSHFRDSTGQLYFGSTKGLISFHPDSITQINRTPLSLQWSSLLLKNSSLNQCENQTAQAIFSNAPIRVSASTDHIILDFFAPEYSGEGIQYQWRILQLGKDWTTLKDPHIDLINLRHGDYTIEIEAVRVGQNSRYKAKLQLTLQVEAPFYLSTGFLVLVAIAISGIVLFIFKWRQKRLRAANDRLEKEVAKQTIQLKQEQNIILQQAGMLKAADEQKTRFFQDISHEICNPLTLILGHATDLLKRPDLSENHQKRLESIQRSARKTFNLIEETIELTKLETGIVLHLKAHWLGCIISAVFKDFETPAAQKKIRFELQDNLPEQLVFTDAGKLEKILSNLIQNAIKYTLEGGSVRIIASYNEASELIVEVQDTGIGIPSEHLDHIFDRFYQVPYSSISGKDRGFGIGLALCQSYAITMGGYITATSTLGVGTTLRLLIPCPPAIPTETENPTPVQTLTDQE
jgi:signal transduction histidine kinase/streptogramin lyase